ncbi:caspase-8-like [Silurus meridionalis]|uniref:caspase-8-like n=1 Tax=Silurus meridionalis TaxID=175797 RepID=UPI001EEAB891|nr:caspase-8-like [Silurus meridionalis]XP_046718653.1 caspase-8-like [Silurus meridionalis]XP_046718654.1 caspase-8-like [Silurus meridionalis]
MEMLRKNKVFLIDTLSTDSSIVLQHVQSDNIITKRDYNNLNQPNYTGEKIIINLLDNVMGKGDETCRKLLKLLEKEDLQEIFPQLKELSITQQTPQQTSHQPSQQTSQQTSQQQSLEGRVKDAEEISEYKMSSRPRGVCLIINNMDFGHPDKYRHGSDMDEEALIKVFKWLGFTPEVYRNQTAEQMKTILSTNSRKQHEGDCFVCCILSHGTTDGVYGTDEEIVSGSDIYEVFNGTFCPSLINKPKVFFIQACRGIQHQLLVKVQADGHSTEKAGGKTEEEEELEADAVQITIPAEADFLVARSTVKGFYSFRGTSGSWFIQSLCEQLNKHCQRGEDIYSILLRVNEEVSKKVGVHDQCKVKQMPVQKFTLRKKLVFHVPQ